MLFEKMDTGTILIDVPLPPHQVCNNLTEELHLIMQ